MMEAALGIGYAPVWCMLMTMMTMVAWLVAWHSGNTLCRINEVALRRARSVFGQVNHLGPKPAS